MITPSILRGIRVSASVKAQPPASGGSKSSPVHLFDLLVAPLDSVDPELVERLLLESPLHLRQTFAYVQRKIEAGMHLTIGSETYPIKGAAAFPDDDGYTFYQLIVEDLTTK